MWKELEDSLDNATGEDLKNKLTTYVDFILNNFGQPKDYYDGTLKEIEEVNKKIEDLILIHRVIFAPDKEKIVEKLYAAGSGTQPSKNNHYKDFYVNLGDTLNLWYYGDKIELGANNWGSYTQLKNRLLGLKRLLETAKLPNIREKSEAYAKELSKQPEGQYR